MLVAKITLLLALVIAGIKRFLKNGFKSLEAPPAQKTKRHKTKCRRNWSKPGKPATDCHSRRAKAYVAPVIQRKWRTPRRSSY